MNDLVSRLRPRSFTVGIVLRATLPNICSGFDPFTI